MFIDRNTRLIVIAIALVACISGPVIKLNGLRNQVIFLETHLTAQYKTNQATLAAYTSGYAEQLGIADRQANQLSLILVNAVKGRYDEGTSGAPSGELFSAVKEAYPDISLASYDKMLDFIQAQREEFKKSQSRLLDQIRNYNTFRQRGLIDSALVRLYAPGENLKVTLDGKTYTGAEALEKMNNIVLDDTSIKAFATGTMPALSSDR